MKLNSLLVALFAFTGIVSSASAQEVPVRFAYPAALNGQIPVVADKAGLAKKNGLAAEYTFFQNGPPMFEALASGNVDVVVSSYQPLTTYLLKQPGTVTVIANLGHSSYSLLVNKDSPAASLADLKGRSGEFGGRIVGIEAGGGLMRATRDSVMKDYGLGEYTLVEGSTPAMLAALDAAIKAQRNIVVTLWEPHWAFSRYPIRALTDPQGAFGKPDNLQAIATKAWLDRGTAADRPTD